MVEGSPRSLRANNFLLICLSWAFIFLGAGALQQFVIPIARYKGWGEFQSYLPLVVIYFSFSLSRFLSGWQIAKLGVKPSLILGAFTYVLFPASFLFSFPYPLILLSMLLWGWGAGIFWTAGTVAILYLSRQGRYGSYSGILYTSLQVGFALGVITLGYLFHGWGENPTYSFAFLISLLGCLLLLLLAPFPSYSQTLGMKDLLHLLSHRRAKIAGLFLFLSAFSLGVMFGSFGEWVSAKYGFQLLALTTFVGYGGRIFLAYPMGYISDRWGEELAMGIGFLFSALGLFSCLLWHSPLSLFVASLALGTQTTTVPVAATSLIGNLFPSEQHHLASGALLSWNSLGIAIALLVSATLGRMLHNLELILLIFASIFLLCALLALLLPLGAGRRK